MKGERGHPHLTEEIIMNHLTRLREHLNKGYWKPKIKLGVTIHFSEIIKK